jgi:hypothetical protein
VLDPRESSRWPRHLVDACVGFLALHGAFNLAVRIEVSTTLRTFAVIAGLTLLVAVIGRRVLKPMGVRTP